MVRMSHVWYVDEGIEDTPEPVYTHCFVLSSFQFLYYLQLNRSVLSFNVH